MRRTRSKEPPRPLQPVSSKSLSSQPSLPERVPGRKRMVQQAAKRQPKTTFKVSISISFRSDFATVLCPPCYVYVYLGNILHHIQTHGRYDCCEWSARSIFLSGADDDGDLPRLVFPSFCARVTIIPLPSPIPSNDDRSTNHSLEPATPLSNSEALVMLRTPTTTCTFPDYRIRFITDNLSMLSRHGRNLDGHRLSIQVCGLHLPLHV